MKKNEANTGSLVIIGGGLNAENEVIYEKILELAGGREEANIAIIPVASSVPLTVAYKYRSVFEEYHSMENCHLIPIAGVDEDPRIQLTLAETANSWGFKGELDFEQSKYTVLNVDLSIHPIELTITPKSNCS